MSCLCRKSFLVGALLTISLLFFLTINFYKRNENVNKPYRPAGNVPRFFKNNSDFFKYKRTRAFEAPFATDYYLEFQRAVRKLTLEVLDKTIFDPRVVIVGQLFGRDRKASHYHDMLTCIQMNLLNPFVSEYHFLQEDDFNNEDIMSLLGAKEKAKISILGKRLMSGQFMEYCNLNLPNRIVLLTNTDIYVDLSIVYTSKQPKDTSLMLSRRQTFIASYMEGENRDHCIGGYVGSHDVFVFNTATPLPQKAIEKLESVPLGYYGSENVIMFHVQNNQEFNYKVFNYCKTISVWHLHEIRGGRTAPPRINNEENTAMAFPAEF